MSLTLKQKVGYAALDYVSDGMKLGIGTGSTAEAFIHALAERVSQGLPLVGVPTSERSAALCRKLNIPLTTLEAEPQLDLTIDGADEIDPSLCLIKGGGGALLREKIVAAASNQMIVIADSSKLVDALGAFPLPVEVNKFGLNATCLQISSIVRKVSDADSDKDRVHLRKNDDGSPFETDGGHLILDASFGRIVEPEELAARLNAIPGVVEHGLFTGLATRAIIAGETEIRIIEASS